MFIEKLAAVHKRAHLIPVTMWLVGYYYFYPLLTNVENRAREVKKTWLKWWLMSKTRIQFQVDIITELLFYLLLYTSHRWIKSTSYPFIPVMKAVCVVWLWIAPPCNPRMLKWAKLSRLSCWIDYFALENVDRLTWSRQRYFIFWDWRKESEAKYGPR